MAPSSSLGAIEEGDEEWEDGEEDWVATEGESQHADRMHEYGEVVERSSDAMANSGHGEMVERPSGRDRRSPRAIPPSSLAIAAIRTPTRLLGMSVRSRHTSRIHPRWGGDPSLYEAAIDS